jgi:hypothetical protein
VTALEQLRLSAPRLSAAISDLGSVGDILTRDKATVSPGVYARFVSTTDHITKIREALTIVKKLAEVLTESVAHYEHQRENELSMMVDFIESTAKRRKDKSIRAPFQKTLEYNSQTAEKAVKTRKKNAEARAAGKGGKKQE